MAEETFVLFSVKSNKSSRYEMIALELVKLVQHLLLIIQDTYGHRLHVCIKPNGDNLPCGHVYPTIQFV